MGAKNALVLWQTAEKNAKDIQFQLDGDWLVCTKTTRLLDRLFELILVVTPRGLKPDQWLEYREWLETNVLTRQLSENVVYL